MDHVTFQEWVKVAERKPAIVIEIGEFICAWRANISEARIGVGGFYVLVSTLETRGLLPVREPWRIGSTWEDFTVGASSLISYHDKWRIFHDPRFVERLMTLVANLSPGESYRDDWHTFPTPGQSTTKGSKTSASSKFIARNAPGPVYAAVADLIKQQEREHHRDGEHVKFVKFNLARQMSHRPGVPPSGSVPVRIGAVKPSEYSKVNDLLKTASEEGFDGILGPRDARDGPVFVYVNHAVAGGAVVANLAFSGGRLRALYVLPAYRRQGIASRLLNGLIENRAGGRIDACLDAEAGPAATSLLEKSGFVATAVYEHLDGRRYRLYRREGNLKATQ
jgi:GNAT superfamily N-acetyltransferase